MPVITAINTQEKNKNRCNLFVDNEFCCGLVFDVVLKYGLNVGMEISQCTIAEMVEESDKIVAFNLALKYISKSLKTKKQVKVYLIGKGFSESIVWYCIDKLKEYNYINDNEYVHRFIESVNKHQGIHLIEHKLMAKGIRKEDGKGN